MKISRSIAGFEPTRLKDPKDLFQALQLAWEKLAGAFNGRISFGDGNHLQSDNIDGVWVSVTTPVAINTNFTITHNLGRLPSGYVPWRKSAACDVYDGTVAATATQTTLKATGSAVDLLLFIA